MIADEYNNHSVPSVACVWAQYGPYHFARVADLRRLLGNDRVEAVEIASQTEFYQWQRSGPHLGLHTLCPESSTEQASFWRVLLRARKAFKELRVRVCFVPSYFPKQSLAVLLAAKSLGLKTVMMNETHAGTARASGLLAWGKRRLVTMFDAALVGGKAQTRYFQSMGIPADNIFPGYDAIDNDHFLSRAREIRNHEGSIRVQYQLPKRYFLSVGRFVAKKNLETLIIAYRKYLDSSPTKETHLVLVGSGEEGTRLRWLCHQAGLPVYEKSSVPARETRAEKPGIRSEGTASIPPDQTGPTSESSIAKIADRTSEIPNPKGGVHFYGFRQIEENPVFYALADAFVLPSLFEEWGLVVNEAMASSLPVIVSETAGCVEDLLEPGLVMEEMSSEAARRMFAPNLLKKARKNGFVFDPKSSEELARALVAMESCPKLRKAMGQNSNFIVEKFSCANFAKNALLAARAAMGKNRPGAKLLAGQPLPA